MTRGIISSIFTHNDHTGLETAIMDMDKSIHTSVITARHGVWRVVFINI